MKKKFKQKKTRVKDFLNDGIWNIDTDGLSAKKARLVKYLQVALITIRTFSTEKIGFQAVALSFFCTMATVPFLAIAFAITGGLGLSGKLKDLLYANFSSHQDVIDTMLQYADNIITTAQSNTMGLISALLFAWLVIWMMMCVENVFNNVWQVKKSRKFTKRFPFYIAILLLSPFVVMMFFSGSIMYSNILEGIGIGRSSLGTVHTVVFWFLFYLIGTLTFSAMYKYIPNTKVEYAHALRAASMSSLVFTALQYLYLETQIFVGRLSMVYGAVAAIPLFMFWLNFGWFIILAGAELSYAFQHVDNYKIKK